MRIVIFILCIITAVVLVSSVPAIANQETDIHVQRLHENPDAASKVVFELPVEVRLLGYTEDRNWYKIKVSFNLGLVNFTYIGWAHVPIGTTEAQTSLKP